MKAEGIKQRGLGAAALLVLAGVVWLLLFGTDPEPAIDTRSRIPPAPELTPYEVAEPRMPSDVEPVDTPLLPDAAESASTAQPGTAAQAPSTAQTDRSEPNADDTAPASPAAEQPPAPESQPAGTVPDAAQPRQPTVSAADEPGLDQRGLPEAWVVQVASLGNAGNAMKLRDQLREQGYKAYTETVSAANGTATRVLVGPKLSREQAERDKASIDKALGLSSLVVRFDPNSGR